MTKNKFVSCLLAGSLLLATGTMGLMAAPKTMAAAEGNKASVR